MDLKETIDAQVKGILETLYDKKALNILAIPVGDKTVLADWFIVCSGRATPQAQALCDELEAQAAGFGLTLRRREGYAEARWIVLDYGDILVHIFHPEERQYYNMEHLWDTDNGTIRYSEQRDAELR